MSIKVKAIETDLSHFSDKDGKSLGFRFVLKPELYSKLTESKVIAEAALRSGVAKGVMAACWEAAGEVIKAWATEGHSVAIPGLGTMRFGLRSESVADVNDVASKMITSRRIVFTPSVGLKQELKQTSIAITCYDKDGNIIKRVTSDAGEVEDPEDENGTQTGDNTGTQTGDNTNQGGSQNQNPSTGGGTTPTPTPNDDDGDEG
jgi:nucleoid DNA-binding protein